MKPKVPLPPLFKPRYRFSQDLYSLLAVVFIAVASLGALLYSGHLADRQISELSKENGLLMQEIGMQVEVIGTQGEALRHQNLMLKEADKAIQKLLEEIKRLSIGIGDNWL